MAQVSRVRIKKIILLNNIKGNCWLRVYPTAIWLSATETNEIPQQHSIPAMPPTKHH